MTLHVHVVMILISQLQKKNILEKPQPAAEVPSNTGSVKRRLSDQEGPSTSKKFLSEADGGKRTVNQSNDPDVQSKYNQLSLVV
jgi:hypothetical protein